MTLWCLRECYPLAKFAALEQLMQAGGPVPLRVRIDASCVQSSRSWATSERPHVAMAASATALDPYPVGRQTEEQYVHALASALAQFGRTARLSIDEMADLDDAGSADIMTEVSRGIDKRLWMVEAHIPVPETQS